MAKSSAGPPPFTITCSNDAPPASNPQHQEDPPPPGWFHPPAPTMQHQTAPPHPGVRKPGKPAVIPPEVHHHHHHPPAQVVPVQPAIAPTSSVVLMQQPTPVVLSTVALPKCPANLTCPSCRHQITTDVKYDNGTKTHLIALVLCLLGCWCGCCLIPYCTNSCKDANHFCPNCRAYIGKPF